MNKWKLVFLGTALLLVTTSSQAKRHNKNQVAADHGFGIGVILGEPTGVSAKYWLGERSALDFAFGLSVGGDRLNHDGDNDFSRVHLHADYLYHFYDVIRTSSNRVPLYFGAGPRVNFAGGYGASFGVRGVAGIDCMFENVPIDIFAEVAPVFQVGYNVGLGLEGGIGVRYFF